MTGIYKITSPSNRVYIGQGVNVYDRWNLYEKYPNSYKNQTKLYNSIKKYGWSAHKKEILEECTKDKLLDRESYYKQLELDKVEGNWGKVLFCRFDGKGGSLSEETKNKIKQSKIDNPMSIKGRKKISKAHKGLIYSQESKDKISKSKKNHTCYNDVWRKNISLGLSNMSDKKKKIRKNKLRKANKGVPKPPDFSSKISKKVKQYDLQNVFIKEWPSIKAANTFLKKGDVSSCINHKTKTCGGFIWKLA